jgi:hypothetical protein
MTTKIDYTKPQSTYYSVLADGKFHTTVAEGTTGATKREYETSDGKKGSKWELVAQAITGKITNLAIYDGDYGKQIQISLGTETTISLNANGNFAQDVMKKLPNIDLEKEVKFAPYSFIDEKSGKPKKGITIYQDGKKIESNYSVKKEDKWVEANGFPKVPAKAKDWDTDDWKVYFIGVTKFLLEEVQKSKLYNAVKPADDLAVEYPKDEIKPEEIPF